MTIEHNKPLKPSLKYSVILAVLLLCTSFNSEAIEIRLPMYADSQHYNKTGTLVFNESHHMTGLEIKHNSLVYGGYTFKDSYNVQSSIAYAGQELNYKGIFAGYHIGVTKKGIKYPDNKEISEGLLPIFSFNAGLTLGHAHVMVGYVPVPKQYGASVGYIRYSLRFKGL